MPRDFDAWMGEVRAGVDEVLSAFIDEKFADARALSPESCELVEEVRSLTMRGGKRLRPAVAAASFVAVHPKGNALTTIQLGAALELLQSYLLIHDDWMDQDSERRGGPSAHFAFAQRHDDTHLGASLGILAGDLASTYSWELLLQAPFPPHCRERACQLFVRIQTEVFAGQQLDLIASPHVERMHDLKTGSYTVRGPAQLGALAGGATDSELHALEAWARPLGIAFQLRDDLLGTFGDSSTTGKPGDDLRHGKRNAVIAEFERLVPKGEQGPILRVWGDRLADETTLQEACELLVSSGATKRVEARLAELTTEARTLLEGADLAPQGKALLRELTEQLTARRH